MKSIDDWFRHMARKNHCRRLKAERLGSQSGSIVLEKKNQRDGCPMGVAISVAQGAGWRITWFDANGFYGDTTRESKAECVLLCLQEGYQDTNRNLLRQLSRLESFHTGCERTTAVARMHAVLCLTNAQAARMVRGSHMSDGVVLLCLPLSP